MGKTEKIIVLAVLLAISGILAVSLNTAGDGAQGPLTRAAAVEGVGPRTVLAAERPAAPELASEAPALLAATLPGRELAPEKPAADAPEAARGTAAPQRAATTQPAPEPAPEGSALLSLEHLQPSGRPDYYFYPWRRGDTFVKVARRLYGDAGHRELLRRHNEGRLDVPVGDQIFVPAFADGASPLAQTKGRTHTVREGESLWSIASKVYGSGANWNMIFDANRDQLPDANRLKSGMVLRIP
ncbi:MAG: hypothetical protein CMJ87_12560 [Planctomycetes bacterium]|nr:hypothetical protein [Planctomycetota bacterium]